MNNDCCKRLYYQLYSDQEFSTFAGIGIDDNTKLIDSAIDYAASKQAADNEVYEQTFYGVVFS